MAEIKNPDDEMKPRFHKKTDTKRKPTKRHLQDKLKALKVDLEEWKERQRTRWTKIPILNEICARRVKSIEKQIEKITKELEQE